MSTQPLGKQLAPLFLRLVLGFGFAFHGFGKLFAEGGHAGFAGMLSGLGVPAPELTAWLVGALEFGGGLALIAGVGIAVLTPLLTAVMLVALFTVHLPAGFNFMNITGMTASGPQFGVPGYEVNLLYIAGLLSLFASGAGAYTLGALVRGRTPMAQGHPTEHAAERLRRVG